MRKTKIYSVPSTKGADNRDAGKHFLITEMDAVRAEKWATRAFFAAAASGIDIPPEVLRMGMGGIAAMGFRALIGIQFVEAEPLLDEMLHCVSIIPDPKKPDVVRPLDSEDVEEVSTLLALRSEVFELHTGFSVAAFLSDLGKAASTKKTPDMSDTQI